MFIAKVVGNVWATRKHKSLEKTKLLLVRRIDGLTGEFLDNELILAVEPSNAKTNAGIGNIVLIMDEGNSARQLLEDKYAPVRTIICGVVDIVFSKTKQKKWH
ncbi:MAG: EutN/CcmL family microcompartment protein [Endomicrobia bacterium]|nr:EutN/CcmL family microcompartment protein [Endomicrobiia bacterium]MCX7940488.1 EutN/CcmL family microcompartment protein [Endomicrobiia bacterium]MDW8055115.1 EutN/CcmL family microcompartment protein [Elusimicrobiota bacterium]